MILLQNIFHPLGPYQLHYLLVEVNQAIFACPFDYQYTLPLRLCLQLGNWADIAE